MIIIFTPWAQKGSESIAHEEQIIVSVTFNWLVKKILFCHQNITIMATAFYF